MQHISKICSSYHIKGGYLLLNVLGENLKLKIVDNHVVFNGQAYYFTN